MRKIFPKAPGKVAIRGVVAVFAAGCMFAGIGSGTVGASPVHPFASGQESPGLVDTEIWPELPVWKVLVPEFPLHETDTLVVHLFRDGDLVKARIYFLKACNTIAWGGQVDSPRADGVTDIKLLAMSTKMYCGDSPDFSLENTEVSFGELTPGRYSLNIGDKTIQFGIR